MAEIPLTRGLVALVDDADLPLVAGLKWHAQRRRNGRWYAAAARPRNSRGSQARLVRMHQVLMPGVPLVDHKNGNGLDNRRSTGNLRPASNSQNQANTPKHRGTSRFKGVRWRQDDQCWAAEIKRDGNSIYLGRFMDEEAAARAYNAAALDLFGEFARLNEVPPATGTQSDTRLCKPRGISRFMGVSWHRRERRWYAVIKHDRRQVYLGAFVVEADAARAYNVAALKCFGEAARLNVVPDDARPAGEEG